VGVLIRNVPGLASSSGTQPGTVSPIAFQAMTSGEQMDGVGALEYVDDNIATRSRKKEFAIEYIWTLNGLPRLR
jgi:hypothetical protein